MRQRLNVARFTAETFDSEVVVLDLQAGVYYSVEGLAAWMLRELGAGAHVDRVLSLVPPEFADQAREICRQLLDETILVAADDDSTPADPAPPPDGAAPPRMTRFDDLQMLLQIDPVHDVDATGWPNPPQRTT